MLEAILVKTAMTIYIASLIVTTLLGPAHFMVFAEEDLYPDDWTDPNDPTYHKQTALTIGQGHEGDSSVQCCRTVPSAVAEDMRAEICGEGEQAHLRRTYQCRLTCEQYDPTLRLILRQMFRELDVDPSEKTFFSRMAKVSLSSLNMKIIGSYLEKETPENEMAMREQVRGALHSMIEVYNEDNSASAWQELLTMAQPWISVLNMMILPPALFFVLRNVMSSRSLMSCIVLVFFIVSMITTYNRMYQQKLAQRMAEAMQRKEDACAPSSLLEQSLEYLSSFITFRKKSSCVAYIESQTVSIVAEISLLDVFSDVLSNSVFGILGNLGRHTNCFFREFYENVPLPIMLLMTATLIFLTVRIKTPLFTFEPLLLSIVRNTTSSMVRYIDGPGSRATVTMETHRPGIQGSEAGGLLHLNRGRNALRQRRGKPHAAIPAPRDKSSSPESSQESSISLASSRSRSLPR